MTARTDRAFPGLGEKGGGYNAGCRILLVEDAPIVALDLAQLLDQEGFEVVGPALNLEEGMRLASVHGPGLDWAVLDFDLGGRNATPIADILLQWRIPIVWCSGFSENADPAFLRGAHLRPCAAVDAVASGQTDGPRLGQARLD